MEPQSAHKDAQNACSRCPGGRLQQRVAQAAWMCRWPVWRVQGESACLGYSPERCRERSRGLPPVQGFLLALSVVQEMRCLGLQRPLQLLSGSHGSLDSPGYQPGLPS